MKGDISEEAPRRKSKSNRQSNSTTTPTTLVGFAIALLELPLDRQSRNAARTRLSLFSMQFAEETRSPPSPCQTSKATIHNSTYKTVHKTTIHWHSSTQPDDRTLKSTTTIPCSSSFMGSIKDKPGGFWIDRSCNMLKPS